MKGGKMGKVLITGGTRGIGLACVRKFIEGGFEVITAVRKASPVLSEDKRIKIIECDLSDRASVRCLPGETGEIDILINNAGVMNGLPYDEYTDEAVDHITELNLRTPVTLSTIYGKQMAERGSGRIVNVASQASVAGNPDIWYGMTKAALVNFTKSLAGLIGGKGVMVNAVSPGPVETEMVSGSPYGERFEKIRKRTYLGRFARPAEIADIVYWLSNEAPPYLNGENIIINNGLLGLEMF